MTPPSSPALQHLLHLDRASPEFGDQLHEILYGPEYVACEKTLEGGDLIWLIDYLDKVRRSIASCHSLLKLAQALDCLDPSSSASRKCLRELRSICGARVKLPTSYTLPFQVLEIEEMPFTGGASSDVYKGTLNGSKICVKRIQVYAQDIHQTTAKVYFDALTFPQSAIR